MLFTANMFRFIGLNALRSVYRMRSRINLEHALINIAMQHICTTPASNYSIARGIHTTEKGEANPTTQQE